MHNKVDFSFLSCIKTDELFSKKFHSRIYWGAVSLNIEPNKAHCLLVSPVKWFQSISVICRPRYSTVLIALIFRDLRGIFHNKHELHRIFFLMRIFFNGVFFLFSC